MTHPLICDALLPLRKGQVAMREMVSRMRRAFGGGSNTDELCLNEYACKGSWYLLFVDGLEFNTPVLGVDLDDDLLVLLERELAVKHH